MDMMEYLEKEVKKRCEGPGNFFGMGLYDHIKSVVENAEFLAKRYGADAEVVMIAAWLHDIAALTDYCYYEKHHIYGAEMAEEILKKLHYDGEKIKRVQRCILHHRGSIKSERKTLEEICVADADAAAHFEQVPSLLYLAYVRRGMGIEEGKDFVRNKLKRSYGKLSERSRRFYTDKYWYAMAVLDGEAPMDRSA